MAENEQPVSVTQRTGTRAASLCEIPALRRKICVADALAPVATTAGGAEDTCFPGGVSTLRVKLINQIQRRMGNGSRLAADSASSRRAQ